MIPKSTKNLKPGDVCLLNRSDGRAVAFAYLGPVAGKRSYFYGALFSPAFEGHSLSSIPAKLHIEESAMVHISCFAENNTPLVGNVVEQIGLSTIQAAMSSHQDLSVGAVYRVWGHRAIIRNAEVL